MYYINQRKKRLFILFLMKILVIQIILLSLRSKIFEIK